MAKATTKEAAVGAGLAAAAAAGVAAGYYFYASKDAEKNRKIAAKWARDMKDDVVQEAKKLQKIDRERMLDIIDGAANAYNSVRNLDRKELTRAAKELKTNWKALIEEASGAVQTRVQKTKKSPQTKKAVKKSSKRSK